MAPNSGRHSGNVTWQVEIQYNTKFVNSSPIISLSVGIDFLIVSFGKNKKIMLTLSLSLYVSLDSQRFFFHSTLNFFLSFYSLSWESKEGVRLRKQNWSWLLWRTHNSINSSGNQRECKVSVSNFSLYRVM